MVQVGRSGHLAHSRPVVQGVTDVLVAPFPPTEGEPGGAAQQTFGVLVEWHSGDVYTHRWRTVNHQFVDRCADGVRQSLCPRTTEGVLMNNTIDLNDLTATERRQALLAVGQRWTECSVADCSRPHEARGYCAMHYKRWKKHGDPLVLGQHGQPRRPLRARLWERVYVTDSCWEWRGHVANTGYGTIGEGGNGGRVLSVHRVVYEILVGPIPDGLTIDHLCRNRACVRPDHLDVVTRAENTLRGMSPSVVTNRTGVCKKGLHRIEGENLYLDRRGRRWCRACRDEYNRQARRTKVQR